MPTYEYACRSCAEHLEVVQSFKDEPLTVCGACGGPLRKVFSPIGIAFKGDGFYRNDSRSAKGRGKESSGKETSGKDESARSKADAAGSGSADSGSAGSASDGAATASSAGEGNKSKSGDSKSGDSKSGSSRSGDAGSGAKPRSTGSPTSPRSDTGSKASSAAS
ncbi:MAG: FmdB family transcriptional regulator [Acidimicrobiales bacterium]|nr:MAG: FmdB family transcriptional regulator [Acidimicrobiales bacterium]